MSIVHYYLDVITDVRGNLLEECRGEAEEEGKERIYYNRRIINKIFSLKTCFTTILW